MNIKATRRRMISCFAQIINDYVLGYKIPELVRHEKIKAKHKGKLSRFKLRNIYAIDSTTITLAYWCINWAKHRQHKAAVKCQCRKPAAAFLRVWQGKRARQQKRGCAFRVS